MREYHEVFGHQLQPLLQEPALSVSTPRPMNSITESWVHSADYDWNQRSSLLSQELNYITASNIIIF